MGCKAPPNHTTLVPTYLSDELILELDSPAPRILPLPINTPLHLHYYSRKELVMGSSLLSFSHFGCYPNADPRLSDSWFCMSDKRIRLPNFTLELREELNELRYRYSSQCKRLL